MLYKIVETSNFGDDYPNESFLNLPSSTKSVAERLVEQINEDFSGNYAPRYWKVVEENYKLQPAFEP